MAVDREKDISAADLAGGDRVAWGNLYAQHNRRVRGIAGQFGYSDPAVDAEDVAQETWLALYRNRSTIDDPNAVPGRISRVAHFRAIDQLKSATRRSKRNPYLPQDVEVGQKPTRNPDTSSPVEEQVVAADTICEAVRVIGNDNQASALLLTLVGYSYIEVGSLQGKPEKSIDNRRRRAVDKLKKNADVFVGKDAS